MYEFRVRLENCAGPGREASVLCRTNGFCSEPTQLGSLPAGTTFVDLQWNRPKTLGNEDPWATRDTNEAISHYEATLKVEDDDADHHDDEGGLPERVCRWAQGSWREDKAGKVVVRLSALRPDTKYMLRNLCAVNSMGKGSLAKPLGFWTIPQSSRMSSIRVKQGVVLITLAQPLPSSIQKCSVSASSTSSPETAQTLEVEPPWTPGELALPFDAMPFVESAFVPRSSHSFRLQTRNAGGWSEWSPPLETEGIARQQGADRAQTLLETAMGSRKIDQLESALAEVSDIELPEETIRENALTLLQTGHQDRPGCGP
ncbi:unnamed protein product [Prorocentrum cordatum]|uniref:Fibronectin type-III domain-containing protein n=1 Tax=Prorocentrum cordatum TaxID=2364126 RepID=A0ABN9VAS5_9DINO|nr:unnamed protein product [Polarella glacialis]